MFGFEDMMLEMRAWRDGEGFVMVWMNGSLAVVRLLVVLGWVGLDGLD